jgi:hypothetical protein
MMLILNNEKITKNFLLILHNIIPKKKRPKKFWIKGKKLENMEIVKEFFKYSNSKAETALDVLSDGDIDYIKSKLNKGGMS